MPFSFSRLALLPLLSLTFVLPSPAQDLPNAATGTQEVDAQLEALRVRLADHEASLQALLEASLEQLEAQAADDAALVIAGLRSEVAELRAELARIGEDVDLQGDSLRVVVEATLEQLEAAEALSPRSSFLDGLSGDAEFVASFPQTPGLNHSDSRLALGGAFELGRGVGLEVGTALEHGQVAGDGSGGTLTVERLRLDLPLSEALDLRVGRTSVPLGVHSERNDPTRYQGVLATATETIILPAIWTTDGLGIHGRATPRLSYELFVGSALDGAGFSASEGIRGGRMAGLAGLSNPALMGRLDYRSEDGGTRAGLGVYEGFGRNGAGGLNTASEVRVRMYALDYERRAEAVDLRLVAAFGDLNDIQDTGTDVGYWLGGAFVEMAWHVRRGLAEGGGVDVDLFVRKERTDTQLHASPLLTEAQADAQDRRTTTLGASIRPAPDVVLKLDYTVGDSAAGGFPDVLALGFGWSF